MAEPLLTPTQCQSIIDTFDDASAFRSTVHMARVSFGEGTYRYFADPLPPLVQALRTRMYPHLAAIANRWAGLLGEDTYPTEHAERCAAAGQHKPTPLVLRYGPSGYNCLHQDVYGDLLFPLQVLFMLNTPDVDFTGGVKRPGSGGGAEAPRGCGACQRRRSTPMRCGSARSGWSWIWSRARSRSA